MNQAVTIQSVVPDFDVWTVTRDPLIKGAIFFTLGPKRVCYYWRLYNGVTILLDPTSYEPFGWMLMEGAMTEAMLMLPLIGTLTMIDD